MVLRCLRRLGQQEARREQVVRRGLLLVFRGLLVGRRRFVQRLLIVRVEVISLNWGGLLFLEVYEVYEVCEVFGWVGLI